MIIDESIANIQRTTGWLKDNDPRFAEQPPVVATPAQASVMPSPYVVFIHSEMAADLVARAEAGEPTECEVRDGELVRLCGAEVRISSTVVPHFEGMRFVTSPLLPVPDRMPRRGAQWKAERGLAGRRWGS